MEPTQAQDLEDNEAESYDQILMTEPMLIKEVELVRARVTARKGDNDGNLIGTYDHNLTPNTRTYLTEFPSGHIMKFNANTISEAIYNNINDDSIWRTYYFLI